MDPRTSKARTPILVLAALVSLQGYGATLAASTLNDVAARFALGPRDTDVLRAATVVATLGAFIGVFVAARSDRIKRTSVLAFATAMFSLFSAATAASDSPVAFALSQFGARIFSSGAFAIALALVVETSAQERRGRAVGILSAAAALGATAAFTYPLTGGGERWRLAYLIGATPILLVPAVRKLPWGAVAAARSSLRSQGLLLATVGGLFFLTHFALTGTAAWWAYLADHRHLTGDQIAAWLVGGYAAGAAGSMLIGALQDSLGRRRVGAGALAAAAVFSVVSLLAAAPALLVPALFFVIGVGACANSLAAEAFPPESRATGVAIARSVFGTIGAIAGPLVIGGFARFTTNVSEAAWVPGAALVGAMLLIMSLPETAKRSLPEIEAATRIPKTSPAPYLFSPAGEPAPASPPVPRETPSVAPEDLFRPD